MASRRDYRLAAAIDTLLLWGRLGGGYSVTSGVTSYLEVLETERQYFRAELEYSLLYQEHLNSYVRLYKALGGGWLTPQEMQSAK